LSRFLERGVFEGELDPSVWFSSIERVTDDFSATADVLYGQREAALVSESNPLLQANLGTALRTLFTSPELSLPVLAIREGALTVDQRRALNQALDAIDATNTSVMGELRMDSLRAMVPDAAERLMLGRLADRSPKEMDLVLPPRTFSLDPPAPRPLLEALAFSIVVPIPVVPPAAELVLPGELEGNP
jgi:hypothetical protein